MLDAGEGPFSFIVFEYRNMMGEFIADISESVIGVKAMWRGPAPAGRPVLCFKRKFDFSTSTSKVQISSVPKSITCSMDPSGVKPDQCGRA